MAYIQICTLGGNQPHLLHFAFDKSPHLRFSPIYVPKQMLMKYICVFTLVGKFYCKPHYCYRLSGLAQRKRPAPAAAAAPVNPKVLTSLVSVFGEKSVFLSELFF